MKIDIVQDVEEQKPMPCWWEYDNDTATMKDTWTVP